jgi:abequosyltransferase
MTISATPTLTIAIPTYNRARFIKLNLGQLKKICTHFLDRIEILISDNCSPDNTPQIVSEFQSTEFPIHYIRNEVNIGSDANIAQCFNLAKGKYVLILGDDDFILEGILEKIFPILMSEEKIGVVCLKPYGFINNFQDEKPAEQSEKTIVFDSSGKYLAFINKLVTFISANIINKSLIRDTNARDFMGENLVQVHLVIKAALVADKNIYFDHYSLGCTRNNSGGYDFSKVFVTNLGNILDSYEKDGLDRKSIYAFENKLLFSYYPYYLLKQRLSNYNNLNLTYSNFNNRFKNRSLFVFWNKPIIVSPRFIAIIWGAITTLIGRVADGDFSKGIKLIKNKLTLARNN